MVKRLNELLYDLAYHHKFIKLIDNNVFGDTLRDEMGRWDSKNKRFLDDDTVHLGKSGLRMFAKNLKSFIVGSKPKPRVGQAKVARANSVSSLFDT